ncbi:hypothetical protein BC826DRAFT_1061796 [Russula brevipes]|nr:hypothetical protein BC826DRAFT_1079591 [Russula brevipes]KAI0282964.1 hypothetical protein BC826DRAFT_1061796 [Russula brevipes]
MHSKQALAVLALAMLLARQISETSEGAVGWPREHRHPCPPPRLFAAQGNSTGTDQLLLYTFPVSTKVSNSSAASQSARPSPGASWRR